MPHYNVLTNEEKEFIRTNCLSMSDEKMAELLQRDMRTIIKYRKKFGVFKKPGGKLLDPNEVGGFDYKNSVTPSKNMSEDIRKKFYQAQFTNSLYYANLVEQFTKEEIDFYLGEWGALCLQFEDIVATEKRQIDEYIKQTILANRTLKHIYTIECEIKRMQQEVEDFRKSNDMENDPIAQEKDQMLINLLQMMNAHAKSISNDRDKTVAMKNKILEDLGAKRRDRVDQLHRRGTTMLGLIQEFQDRKTRENQGKHMELVKMAKDKKKKEWRQPQKFPDGSTDCVLLDEESTLPKKDIILLGRECVSIDKILAKGNGKVLIVDDQLRRQQFFGDVFKGHSLDFASNNYLAMQHLQSKEYDLICIDYDLSMGDKGDYIAKKISEENLSPNSLILVHSMNKDGSSKIAEFLQSKEIEVYPFEDIVKNLGEKYAQTSNGSGTDQSDDVNASAG